jgi:hypothetical protein
MRLKRRRCHLDLIAAASVSLMLVSVIFEIEVGWSLRCHIGLGDLDDLVFWSFVFQLDLRYHIGLGDRVYLVVSIVVLQLGLRYYIGFGYLIDPVFLIVVLQSGLRCHIGLHRVVFVLLRVFLCLCHDKKVRNYLDLMNSFDGDILVVAGGQDVGLVVDLVA